MPPLGVDSRGQRERDEPPYRLTIMVLELRVPHGDTSLAALQPLWGVFLSYVLSFVYLGIYWNNHHHMLHTTHTVTGGACLA